MRREPEQHHLIEMSFAWQDIEAARGKRHPGLAAALEHAFRVEAVAGESNWAAAIARKLAE